jgi:predicted HTH transcriptional regulator
MIDKDEERMIARTVCAFSNSEGGTLIIGVDDDGKALGLDGDFSTLARGQGRDRFEQVFASIITEYLDEAQQYIHSCFEEYQGKLIYVVAVDKSPRPVFCLFDGEHEFYVRKLTATRKLDAKETMEYASQRF